MSKTDGEYELVLGNRQLLSAFFVVVILFGVFFTMGYVVGRNSAPPAEASSPPLTAGGKPEAALPADPPALSQPVEPPKEAPAAVTRPAPSEEKHAAAPKPPVSAPRETPVSAKIPSESASGGVVPINPGPGRMYLQVAAAGRPQAEAVADTLKQKGFPAFLTPGPRPDLVRVVVGPFADAATLGKAKADLESAGFRPIVRK